MSENGTYELNIPAVEGTELSDERFIRIQMALGKSIFDLTVEDVAKIICTYNFADRDILDNEGIPYFTQQGMRNSLIKIVNTKPPKEETRFYGEDYRLYLLDEVGTVLSFIIPLVKLKDSEDYKDYCLVFGIGSISRADRVGFFTLPIAQIGLWVGKSKLVGKKYLITGESIEYLDTEYVKQDSELQEFLEANSLFSDTSDVRIEGLIADRNRTLVGIPYDSERAYRNNTIYFDFNGIKRVGKFYICNCKTANNRVVIMNWGHLQETDLNVIDYYKWFVTDLKDGEFQKEFGILKSLTIQRVQDSFLDTPSILNNGPFISRYYGCGIVVSLKDAIDNYDNLLTLILTVCRASSKSSFLYNAGIVISHGGILPLTMGSELGIDRIGKRNRTGIKNLLTRMAIESHPGVSKQTISMIVGSYLNSDNLVIIHENFGNLGVALLEVNGTHSNNTIFIPTLQEILIDKYKKLSSQGD